MSWVIGMDMDADGAGAECRAIRGRRQGSVLVRLRIGMAAYSLRSAMLALSGDSPAKRNFAHCA